MYSINLTDSSFTYNTHTCTHTHAHTYMHTHTHTHTYTHAHTYTYTHTHELPCAHTHTHTHMHTHAHSHIQPENIVLKEKDGKQLKIIDFGTAQDLSTNPNAKAMVGTPEFIGEFLSLAILV